MHLNTKLKTFNQDLNSLWYWPVIEQALELLESRGVYFRPHFYISDEWFCADGTSSIAIPFYLNSKKLITLEREQTGIVEGNTKSSFLKLITHEIGHAIDHAYQLEKESLRIEVFGNHNKSYPLKYRPNANSKDFVINLPDHYAQSHPYEDWAETFSVWLQGRKYWEKKYKSWGCLHKLIYMDELLSNLKSSSIKLDYSEVEPIKENEALLKDYYTEKRRRYSIKNAHHLRKYPSKKTGLRLEELIKKNKLQLVNELKKTTELSGFQIENAISSFTRIHNVNALNIKDSKSNLTRLIKKHAVFLQKTQQDWILM